MEGVKEAFLQFLGFPPFRWTVPWDVTPRFVQDIMISACFLFLVFLHLLLILASGGGFFGVVLVWRQDLV